MKFSKILNEMPRKIGSILNSPHRKSFIEKIISKIESIDSKRKKFGKYEYLISEQDNIFALFEDSELIGFITFVISGDKFQILNIENISREKGFSILCFKIILKYYSSILTGELLSNENIKAHFKFLDIFKIFVFNSENNTSIEIDTIKEIEFVLKQNDKNTQFLIKDNFSNILEFHNKNYQMINLTEEELLEDYIKECYEN